MRTIAFWSVVVGFLAAGFLSLHRAVVSPSSSFPMPIATSSTEPVPGPEIAPSVRAALESTGWSVISDREIATDGMAIAGDLDGTRRLREWFATRPDVPDTVKITTFAVANRAALTEDVLALEKNKRQVGTRNGYLIPVPGMSPGSVFVLFGRTQLLFIEVGAAESGNAVEWGPEDPSSELRSLIERLPLE